MNSKLYFEKSIACPNCGNIVYVYGEVISNIHVNGIDIIIKERICDKCNKTLVFKPYIEYLVKAK